MSPAPARADPAGMTAPHADLAALRRGTPDGTLELLFQPEVELATGALVAMEGLLRWHRDEVTMAPEEFLELAELTGEGAALEHWVLETGAAEVARWQGLPGGLTRQLWLNVSTAHVRERGCAERVAALVAAHGFAPDVLGLEVSEQTVQDLGRDALPLLTDLREAGVALALDDVDSWYSTVGAVELLPLSAVKLAPHHVREVDACPGDPVAAVVVAAAHDHGVRVVAEGVETWGEAARLTELGCDRAHGWLYSSPQRADKARWLLAQGRGWRGDELSTTAPAVPLPRGRTL